MSAPLEGRIALVTGGSRGIGRAIALALARNGADVALAARDAKPAADVVREIEGIGRRGMALSLDVSDLDAVTLARNTVAEGLGKVSVLVNNAGITRDRLLLRMKPEDWNEVLRVNLDGTFHCTKVFSKDMLRGQWGRIINITSVVGTLGNPGQANYAASKAGVVGFTRSVARELAGRNVTVNAVAPGYIKTAMTEDLPDSAKETLMNAIPVGRLGTPEEVAEVVSFLAREDAGYITGQVIHVDGGMAMA